VTWKGPGVGEGTSAALIHRDVTPAALIHHLPQLRSIIPHSHSCPDRSLNYPPLLSSHHLLATAASFVPPTPKPLAPQPTYTLPGWSQCSKTQQQNLIVTLASRMTSTLQSARQRYSLLYATFVASLYQYKQQHRHFRSTT
jgi:hypothetical protein